MVMCKSSRKLQLSDVMERILLVIEDGARLSCVYGHFRLRPPGPGTISVSPNTATIYALLARDLICAGSPTSNYPITPWRLSKKGLKAARAIKRANQ